MKFYDFKVKDQKGQEVSLKDYEGKVVLVFNSATECGFTPQYEELEALHEKYADKGLAILEFPCNQFGGQAPGSDEEINQFCSMKFNTKFKRFKKTEVNGERAEQLFKYLYGNKPFKGFDLSKEPGKGLDEYIRNIRPDYAESDDIKWNFTKFLIDRQGNVVDRFEPTEGMERLEENIKELL